VPSIYVLRRVTVSLRPTAVSARRWPRIFTECTLQALSEGQVSLPVMRVSGEDLPNPARGQRINRTPWGRYGCIACGCRTPLAAGKKVRSSWGESKLHLRSLYIRRSVFGEG